MRSLNKLLWLRRLVVRTKWLYLTKFWGMDIHRTASFSLKTHFDQTHPSGIHVGKESYLSLGATILSHDMIRGMFVDTWIGDRCFIGARSIVLPGIRIGDGSVVAAGSVVTKDVPPGCLVGGNPARVLRSGIKVGAYGRFEGM